MIVSIIIFIVILSALIIVHELGHFLVARFFGIRVDEFGLGFPPRIKKLFTWKGTPFTLNLLPFGGFVKIFGENPASETDVTSFDNFQSKNHGIQASVLVAGVLGNFVFAWFLISLGFTVGLPLPEGFSLPMSDPEIVLTAVLPNSPAFSAGLKAGDVITSLRSGSLYSKLSPEGISEFIGDSVEPITFTLKRGEEIFEKTVVPIRGIVEDRLAAGISMEVMGEVQLPFYKAIWYGLKTTSELTVITAKAIVVFISEAVLGKADFSTVSGPVGIVGIVGDTIDLGFVYLLTFTALISINLSIINLLPFPALDGGRLLFVIIETVSRRPVSPRIFNTLNTIGFALLIFLMIFITIHDIRNIL